MFFRMLVLNRYSFVKQISVWNQTEKMKLQSITFTLFSPFKSARFFLFSQKYLFNIYTYTLCFLNRLYMCLNDLSSSATDHHYSVLFEGLFSKPYRFLSSKEEGLGQQIALSFCQNEICVCGVV